jgi:undecaprenyl-diphosphatase
MSLLQAIILGAVQGITEFLPISSSGHLTIAEHFLHVSIPARDLQAFDVVLHAGSLTALFFCYRVRWWQMIRSPFGRDRNALRLLLLLLIATIPAGLAGIFFGDLLAATFKHITSVGVTLGIAGLTLLIVQKIPGSKSADSITPLRALLIGIAQSLALIPGFSRSAMTMSAGRANGLSQREAVDFSFLMAVPVISGAAILIGVKVLKGDLVLPPLPIVAGGFVASLIMSVAAIELLRLWVRRFPLALFSLYLIPLSLVILGSTVGGSWQQADVQNLILHAGAVGVFVFSFIEVTPPISFFSPGVVALVVAGSLASHIVIALLFVIAGIAGVTLSNLILYSLGRRFGRNFAHRLGLTEHRLHRLDTFIARYGFFSIVVGQFVGAVRPFISFVAGTGRMPRRRYYPAMLLGAALFPSSFVLAGFFLREWATIIASSVGIVGGIIFCGAIAVGWWRLRK